MHAIECGQHVRTTLPQTCGLTLQVCISALIVANVGSMHTHLSHLTAIRPSVIEGFVLDYAWKRSYHL